MNSKGCESLLISEPTWGVFRNLFGASWGVLSRHGSVLGLLEKNNRLGAVLETFLESFWKRLGRVLGTFWGVLETCWGRLVGFFEVSWPSCGSLGHLEASWRHLMRDCPTKKWLHASMASKIPFFMHFCYNFLSTSTSRTM